MPVSKPDYYNILGVSHDADQDAIKKAFRKKARKAHPDAGGDEEEFKRINEAYEVLSDPDKRRAYDAYDSGTNPFAGASGVGGAADGYNSWNDLLEFMRNFGGQGGRASSPFDNMFADVFTTSWSAPHAGQTATAGGEAYQRPENLDANLNVEMDLADILSRHVTRITYNIDGEDKTLELKPPADAGASPTLMFRGRGRRSSDGKRRGDLSVQLVPRIPDGIEIDGADIKMELKVPFTVAVAGGKRSVKLLNGRTISVHIPAMTKSGTTLKIAGQGTKSSGSCFLKILLDIPSDLTREELNTIAAMAR